MFPQVLYGVLTGFVKNIDVPRRTRAVRLGFEITKKTKQNERDKLEKSSAFRVLRKRKI